jgi:hypothetical protein
MPFSQQKILTSFADEIRRTHPRQLPETSQPHSLWRPTGAFFENEAILVHKTIIDGSRHDNNINNRICNLNVTQEIRKNQPSAESSE